MRLLLYRLEYLGHEYPEKLPPGAGLEFWREFTDWMNETGDMIELEGDYMNPNMFHHNLIQEKAKFFRKGIRPEIQIWNGNEKCGCVILPCDPCILIDFNKPNSICVLSTTLLPFIARHIRKIDVCIGYCFQWQDDADDERARSIEQKNEWISRRELMEKVDDILHSYERVGLSESEPVRLKFNEPIDYRSWIRKCFDWKNKWLPGFKFYVICTVPSIWLTFNEFLTAFAWISGLVAGAWSFRFLWKMNRKLCG